MHAASRRAIAFWPDVTPLAGIVLLLVSLYAQGANFHRVAPYTELPGFTPTYGCQLRDGPVMIVTINKAGQLFVENDYWQEQIIKQLARAHNVSFSFVEQRELAKLPYLVSDIAALPAYLAASPAERHGLLPSPVAVGVPPEQLLEVLCIAQEHAWMDHRQGPYCYIRTDQSLPFSKVRGVLEMLGEANVHRFNLVTEINPVGLKANNYAY